MTVVEKVDYLLKCLDLTERQFAKKYRIRKNVISKWRQGSLMPGPENVAYLCDKFNLSISDFLDEQSTLDITQKYADEHRILGKFPANAECTNSEDFPHEENTRYEEKD